jgi:hypothetical protein
MRALIFFNFLAVILAILWVLLVPMFASELMELDVFETAAPHLTVPV